MIIIKFYVQIISTVYFSNALFKTDKLLNIGYILKWIAVPCTMPWNKFLTWIHYVWCIYASNKIKKKHCTHQTVYGFLSKSLVEQKICHFIAVYFFNPYFLFVLFAVFIWLSKNINIDEENYISFIILFFYTSHSFAFVLPCKPHGAHQVRVSAHISINKIVRFFILSEVFAQSYCYWTKLR